MLKHLLSFRVALEHLPPPAPRSQAVHFPRPQATADPLPLVLLCGGTLRSDNFLQSSEAAEALRPAACLPIPPRRGSPGTDWAAVGSRQPAQQSRRQISSKVGGLVGIREREIHI